MQNLVENLGTYESIMKTVSSKKGGGVWMPDGMYIVKH